MASHLDFAGATFVDGMVDNADDTGQVADVAVESHRRIVIAFVGLAFEARIAAGPGVLVVCRTAGSELATVADSAVRQGYRGMISFGVAGGLAAHLRAGDWVVASAIRESQTVRATDAVWSRKLLGMIAGAKQAEDIVASGKADMVAMARAFLDDPHWGWHAAQVLGAEVTRPPQYARTAPKLWPGTALRG